MIEKEQASEKVRAGWMRVWAGFEAMAVKEETATSGLADLLDKLDSDQRVKIYKKEFSDVQKVGKVVEAFDEAYSQTVKVEFVVKNLDDLVEVVIEYGPSGMEVLEPKEIKLTNADAQAVLNRVGALMHSYAAAGLGGAVLIRGKQAEQGEA